MRTFLESIKDADPSKPAAFLKTPSIDDPLYAGLKAMQPNAPGAVATDSTAAQSKSAIDAETLRSIVCNDPAFIDPSDPHKETLLADLINGRNRTYLTNLCQRQRAERSDPSTGQDAGTGAGAGADLQGTPLSQSTTGTSVGSIMPRFLYAEYV